MSPARPLALLLLAALAGTALADEHGGGEHVSEGHAAGHAAAGHEPDGPTLQEPLPFDHGEHAGAFDAGRLTCTDCHPVGLAQVEEETVAAPEVELPPPRSTCHGCHLGQVQRALRAAPSTCGSCHADLMELLPSDHDEAWTQGHAPAARAGAGTCQDCHEAAWCFACHDDRGPLAEQPHDPGFRIVHGIEARLDPRSCTTCHSGASCVECHESGGSPW